MYNLSGSKQDTCTAGILASLDNLYIIYYHKMYSESRRGFLFIYRNHESTGTVIIVYPSLKSKEKVTWKHFMLHIEGSSPLEEEEEQHLLIVSFVMDRNYIFYCFDDVFFYHDSQVLVKISIAWSHV